MHEDCFRNDVYFSENTKLLIGIVSFKQLYENPSFSEEAV